MNQQKNMILHLAGATMIGMPLIAFVVDYFSSSLDLRERIFIGDSLWIQLGIGLGVGLIAAFFAAKISEMKFMEKTSEKYSKALEGMKFNYSEILFISLAAGFGEEILFRGAMQFFLGIPLTAIIFVAVHGYLNPKDWRISTYGLYMTVVIYFFGWFAERNGIWTAIMAHTVVDVYLLLQIKKTEKNKDNEVSVE